MSDEKKTQNTEPVQPGEAWRDVGKQFETLGTTLAAAVRAAWQDEGNRKRVQEMQTGLEAMITEVSHAIKETAASPQGQQVRGEVNRAAQNLRVAGEQTMQEVRPHLLSALKQVNEELQKLLDRMEEGKGTKPPQPPGQ